MPMQKNQENIGILPRTPKWQFQLSDLPELSYEQQLVAGVDEVGRGALFGSVVAAAVILPLSAFEPLAKAGVRDSKKLTATRRLKLAEQIKSIAIDCQIGFADVSEIDSFNILQASLLAMKRAVTQLKVQPDLCLVDGKQPLPELSIPQLNLIKGDERSLLIAAASIVAKVWRDQLITQLATEYPMYDLLKNKGYGTAKHLLALQQYGPSPLHRMSFAPCQQAAEVQLKTVNC
ncbi:MAG TPA: ribonuclease HII [Oculatellaceae cyanobacterium]|jgi:ribonuclease HII